MRIKSYLLPIAAVLALLVGFFMPSAIASMTDSRRIGSLSVIDTQSISFEVNPETGLNMAQRISLAASMNTELFSIESGQHMDQDAAGSKAVSELAGFFIGGGIEVNADECVVESSSASLVIDARDPSLNMIIWEIRILNEVLGEMTVTIDDETGIILRIINRQTNMALLGNYIDDAPQELLEAIMNTAAQTLASMLTEYYGVPVVLEAYEYGSVMAYYTVVLYDHGMEVPMYGVIRSIGFTMNERT